MPKYLIETKFTGRRGPFPADEIMIGEVEASSAVEALREPFPDMNIEVTSYDWKTGDKATAVGRLRILPQ